jgi:outer membrane lipoprotein-sorting protein
MKVLTSSASVILLLMVGLDVCAGTSAQPTGTQVAESQPVISADEIISNLVRRNLERARTLSGYQGTRVYTLKYQGFPGTKSAEMVVDVHYRAPGTKEFTVRSEKGSKLLIDRVFNRMLQSEKEAITPREQSRVALTQDNYTFILVGQETLASGRAYILGVVPRTDNKLLYRGQIWVDAEDFAVVRIEAVPAKNPSFWAKRSRFEQVYAKVGDYWLPVSNRSTSNIRLGGSANLMIDYLDYRITDGTVSANDRGSANPR